MENWASTFAMRKADIATAFFKGGFGGSYSEAVLILSSALSGIASEVWPGRGIDRKRFVEAMVSFCQNSPHPSMISLPLLVDALEAKGAEEEASLLKKKFIAFNDAQIVTGSEVDRKENEVLSVCPTISLDLIRDSSYANILYTEVRSGFVHEYQTGNRADSQPMTSKESAISYSNWLDLPNRRIVFHFPWLVDSIVSLATSVDPILDKLPFKLPDKWWVQG